MADEPTTGANNLGDAGSPGADEVSHAEDTPSGPPRNTNTRSTLAFRFLRKAFIFLIAGLGLAVWGLIDAVWVYPERGEKYASWAEKEYLVKADEQGRLRPMDVNLDDPAAEFARLDARRGQIMMDLQDLDPADQRRAELEHARLKWLEGLSRLNRLDPEYTTYTDTAELRTRLSELNTQWQTTSAPKPLAAYDIPSQWVFVLVGTGVAVWQIALLASVRRRVYQWDPETKTLTFPEGTTLRPEDITSFDKRKWDRFLVFLGIREGHPKLGGQELKLDLYRHNHLEDWVKEMFFISNPEEYRASFPEEFERPDDAEAQPATDADAEDAEPVAAGAGDETGRAAH